MKIFQTTKLNLASMDLDANQSLFHKMQLLHILQGFLAIVLQCIYLIYVASTIREYMNSIFMTAFGILAYIVYWSMIFQTKTIFEFMDEFEKAINKSKIVFFFLFNLIYSV